MPDFRRGAAAIDDAATSRGGGNFRPFVPQIQWKNDKEERYVLFLNPVGEIPTVDYHEWIPCGKGEKANGETYTKWEQFISRKDPAIGEDEDELEDRLGVKPKARSIAVAVELEAVTETDDKGRTRPVGFTVATDTYNRKTDNGEVEVIQPKIGLVIQAAQNFFGWLSSYDASQGPIEETPMQVTRRGKDTSTTYDFIAMEGRPVDLSPLLAYLDGVSYLADELDELVPKLPTDDDDAARMVAAVLLNKRLNELADKERYDELVRPIEEIEQKYGKKGNKAKPERQARPARPQRRTQPAKNEDPAERPAEPQESAPAAEEAPATTEAPKDRFAALRQKIEAQNAA